MKEKKDRVDDALCATRAAIEEGVVAGGGTTYIRALSALKDVKGANADEQTGINIVERAIEEPLRQIVANAGGEGAVVVQKVREGEGDFGYNARTDVYEDMRKAVEMRGQGCKPYFEASGGLTLATAPAAAETGVDFMSFGCLTHSVPSLDLGLDFTVEF